MSGTDFYPQTPHNPHVKRTWRHTVAIYLLIIYAGIGWLRLYNALRFSDYLTSLGLWPGPLYMAVSGGMIGLGFSCACLLMLVRHRHAAAAVRLVCVFFLTWFWADRIWLSDPQSFLNLLAISLAISLATLVLMAYFIQTTKKPLGGQNHEQ